MMNFLETGLEGAWVVQLESHKDERGSFTRTFCKKEFEKIRHHKEFVQMNHSVTTKKGTVRGMHFQVPPFAEIKLIRCIRGAVFDVVVDVRENSPTFLKWFGTLLSEDNQKMMYVPEGFAHGFQSQENGSELLYNHTQFYTPEAERGLNIADKMLNIKWPLAITGRSDRDTSFPFIDKNFTGISL